MLGIEDNGIKKSFLIEKFLDGKYKKFNNNLGYVDNDTKQESPHLYCFIV